MVYPMLIPFFNAFQRTNSSHMVQDFFHPQSHFRQAPAAEPMESRGFSESAGKLRMWGPLGTIGMGDDKFYLINVYINVYLSFLFLCITYVCIYIYTCIYINDIFKYIYIYIFKYVYIYVYIYIFTYVYIYIYIYVKIIYIYMCVCVHMYISPPARLPGEGC